MKGLRISCRGSARFRSLGTLFVAPLLVSGSMLAAPSGPTPVAAGGGTPIAAHSMLQLNAPASFADRMFSEAVALHASELRLDTSPSEVFTAPLAQPDYAGLNQVVGLARRYQLRVVADLSGGSPPVPASRTSTR